MDTSLGPFEDRSCAGFVRAFAEAAPDAIVISDDMGIVRLWNSGAERIFGYRETEAVGRPVSMIIAEDFRASHEAGLRCAADGEIPRYMGRTVELVGLHRDGSEVPVELSIGPWSSPSGLMFCGIIRDLSARKQAEEMARLQTAGLDAAANAIVFTDCGGTIVWVNPAFTRLTGYTRAEAVGENPRMLNAGVQSDAFYGDLWETVLAGRVWNGEIVNRKKDGSLYTEEMTIAPVRDQSGMVTHHIAIKQDVSDRVRLREAEHEARTAAEQATRMKTAFLATMSHEIRTPMNGVIGMTDLLLDSELDQEQRRCAELVKDSADSLLTIINHILDFSKVEAGQLELEAVAFDPSAVVETAVRMFAANSFAQGIELVCVVDDQFPATLIGDPGRLRQIITNLVGNALKFTSSGEVVVTAKLLDSNHDSITMSISVRDSGIGIEADKLDLIFEDFSQADSSTTREYGGTGLGLAITRRLVALFQGHIGVESTPGEGSTFTVTLPFGLDATRTVPRLVEDFSRLRGARVIVVDDNSTNRALVREMLARQGALVVEAESADVGMQMLRAAACDPFDLAIIDCYMPGGDGFELAARVQKDTELDQLRLMMLTSAGQAGDAQRCRDLGIAAYLSKPISRVDLIDTAAVLLGPHPTESDVGFLITRHTIEEARIGRDILLVEDNLVNQMVASSLLKKRGHRVTTVSNGALAVEAVGKHAYDVVLMDIEMPVMSGPEAASLIKRDVAGRQPTIIALTAHTLGPQVEEIISGDFDGFIGKPFTPVELYMAVESAPTATATSPNVSS